MSDESSRRAFLQQSLLGLGVATTAGVRLRADAQPTEASGGLGTYGDYLAAQGETPDQPPADNQALIKPVTEPNILGPFHREGAPYRAKITPPLEPGNTLLIRGTVWGFDTQKPLPGVTLDIWQANAAGRYDNDDPKNPPAPDVFLNRARVLTDELGRYEFETIHPGTYKIGPQTWRPPHIHYLVRAGELPNPGHPALLPRRRPPKATTPLSASRSSSTSPSSNAGDTEYRTGRFDVVLATK